MSRDAKWHTRASKYRRNEGAGKVQFKARVKGQLGQGNSKSYIWRIDLSSPYGTRAEHKAHNGKKFRWDDPPVFDSRTGQKGHPGSDDRCRCYAEPVPD